MGNIDILTKDYMRQPVIFADVFNQFLYHGKQVILPEQLVELDTTELAIPYGTDQASVPEQRYRDVAKTLLAKTDGRLSYCILAVENEAKINYAMPVKDGLYDFMQLSNQVKEAARSHKNRQPEDPKPSGDEYLSGFWKSDRLLPVVTVVVYFGAGEWDGPRSLKEMYVDCEEEILQYAADYRINLITPRGLSDAELDGFRTNMREIMYYIKYSNDKERLARMVATESRFQNVERSAAEIINAATNSHMKIPEGKETVNMCLAIQGMLEDSRQEGWKEGEKKGRQEGEKKGRKEGWQEGRVEGAITFARKFGISIEEVKRSLMAEYSKDEKEADELLKTYWK